MPLSMFFLIFAAVAVVGFAVNTIVLRLVARVFGSRETTWARSIAFVAASTVIGLLSLIPRYLGAPSALGLFAGLGSLVATYLFFRWSTRLRRVRSIGAFLVFCIANVAMGLALGLSVKFTLVDAYITSTESMAPTLVTGDRFLVDRLAMPTRWELAAFHSPTPPGDTYVKRVVGLPGETVEIVAGEIRINGTTIPKPVGITTIRYDGKTAYFGLCRGGTDSPFTLGPDEYFVLGDNTAASLDSRYWTETCFTGHQVGAVPESAMIGTVRAVYWPQDRMRVLRY